MSEAKEYIGLWTKRDKNGLPFLSGSTEDTVYFIFSDKDDENKKTLHTMENNVEGAKLKKVGVFENGSGDNGDFRKLDNMYIFENKRREKETHPHFNLVVYND